jgi:hypothetical protein
LRLIQKSFSSIDGVSHSISTLSILNDDLIGSFIERIGDIIGSFSCSIGRIVAVIGGNLRQFLLSRTGIRKGKRCCDLVGFDITRKEKNSMTTERKEEKHTHTIPLLLTTEKKKNLANMTTIHRSLSLKKKLFKYINWVISVI